MAKLRIVHEALEVDKYLEQQQQANASSEYDLLYEEVQDTVEDEAVEQESDYEVATEGFSLSSVKEALIGLAQLGLHYSPIVLSKLYKGTVYGIGRLATGLVNSVQYITDYRVRHQKSFEQLREDITRLIKVLDQMDGWEAEGMYSKAKVINALKIQDTVNPIETVPVLTEALSHLVKDLSQSIDNDIGYIKQLIASVTSRSIKTPHIALQAIPLKTYLVEGSIEGYEENSEETQAYHYATVLPGDIRVLATLPATQSDNIDLLTKAYNRSALYLGLDHSSFIAVEAIPYQSKDDIASLLHALDALCLQALDHVSFYERIQRSQRNLTYLFRLYISSITTSQQKLSSKVTLIDHVNLKALFIHRLYLPFSIDLHTYVTRVVRSGLQYTEDHIKQFS